MSFIIFVMTIDIHIDLLNSFIGEKTAGESATKGAVSTTRRGNRRIFARRGHKPEWKIQWQLIDRLGLCATCKSNRRALVPVMIYISFLYTCVDCGGILIKKKVYFCLIHIFYEHFDMLYVFF